MLKLAENMADFTLNFCPDTCIPKTHVNMNFFGIKRSDCDIDLVQEKGGNVLILGV